MLDRSETSELFPELEGYLDQIELCRKQLRQLTKGMSDEAANWRPDAEDHRSVYSYIIHLTNSDGYWFRQIIGGEPFIDRGGKETGRKSEWDEEGNLADALDRWEETSLKSQNEIIRNLTLEQLGEKVYVPSGGIKGNVPRRWAILHQIRHMGEHQGHIQLTRQLWEAMNNVKGTARSFALRS